MKSTTAKMKVAMVGLSLLAISVESFAGTIKIDLKNTCAYTTTTDANGNMIVSCSNGSAAAPAPTPANPPPAAAPPARAPASKREWNKAFSSLNNIPYNAKVDSEGYYNYLKTLYQNKPLHYKLPPGGLL